jgi:hypothetical protein
MRPPQTELNPISARPCYWAFAAPVFAFPCFGFFGTLAFLSIGSSSVMPSNREP